MKKKKQMGPKKKRNQATFKEQAHNPDQKSSDKPGRMSTASLDQGHKSNRADDELDKLVANRNARKYPAASRRYK